MYCIVKQLNFQSNNVCPLIQAKYEDIKKVVKAAAEGPLKGILGYTEDQVQQMSTTGSVGTLHAQEPVDGNIV